VSADDILAIQRLVTEYADAVCRRDEVAWSATWSRECHWELSGGRSSDGREATVQLWRDAIARYPWVAQVVTGCLVDIDSEVEAHGTCYILELNHLLDGSGALHLGHYTDRYLKTDGMWQFSERRLHLIYRGPLDPGAVLPLPLIPR